MRSLENMSMRASQGNDATFHLGEKYPIQNASYAPDLQLAGRFRRFWAIRLMFRRSLPSAMKIWD